MDSKENEPQPTSFQAGTPSNTSMQEAVTVQPDDDDESVDDESPTIFGHLAATLKSQERLGLIVAVGIQLAVLFSMIVIGSAKALDAFFLR